ncbi:ABC transporter permease [Actinoalloteichus hymeniacidonis]|uniref:Permease component of ribose/xylose/arabinose/galactoside ABC-type transporters n=1 Tax=Actinoalloteichus hymeniacidonis TaxID=340345 RepID=A0AAC9HR19_9PSEU|nr:ABC transporter permease [Actinoalloteichus hymeniacidonis]AOS63843.1 permease component of ribose/xylose/arabinose/galactoside ABC-type transporters [Actinoalloteichus hymeniacidonis]MBB5908101.1 ribose/xylose/arabinose/galactoside ABC-type transport system permease subunit [Actinoalloteichus hymeniacidonis]
MTDSTQASGSPTSATPDTKAGDADGPTPAPPDVPEPPRPWWRPRLDADWVRRNGVFVALALLVLINVIITPNFVSEGTLRLQLIQVAPVLIVALGMALVIGTQGIDLSVGAVMALAAALIPLYIGYGAAIAILVALLAGCITGAIAGSLVARVGVQPIVATLGLMVAGRGVANLIGGEIKSIREPGIVALGTGNLLGIPYVVLIAAAVSLAVWFAVRRTIYGRRLLAIGGNKRAAELAGLPVRRVLITTYVVCGLLAALAGALLAARSQASDPTRLGLLIELSAITAVVIGGTPLSGGQVRVVGTIAGALLMQLITATLIFHDIPDSTAQIVQAVIVVAAVYVQLGRRKTGPRKGATATKANTSPAVTP